MVNAARFDETAALVALLRLRPGKLTWPQIATLVADEGSAAEVFDRLSTGDGLMADPSDAIALNAAQADVKQWTDAGLNLVTVLDADYPSGLLSIAQLPPLLFWAGQLREPDLGMSVVGSRDTSTQGRNTAGEIARRLVARNLTVISGLASGIDAAAHTAALDSNGRTVAVLGTGITRTYPAANRALQAQISERGLLISQFWPDAPGSKSSFPMRNATMSGYGLATIVVEAGEFSGTRIQARVAVDHGRAVILTDTVARTTTWGRDMVGLPGVFVASTMAELDDAIDEILRRRTALARTLDAVGPLTPVLV